MSNLLASTSFGDLTGLGFDGQAAQSDGLLHLLAAAVTPRETGGGPIQRWLGAEWRGRMLRDDRDLVELLRIVWRLLG